ILNAMEASDKSGKIWVQTLFRTENNNHAYFLVKRAVKNGARLVVIDSRYTKIAEKSDIFLHIHPGTEHFLAKLLIIALFEQDVCDIEFLKKSVDSYSNVISEITNNETEISFSQIGINVTEFLKFVDFLREFKHHTLFLVGYGVQKDFYGGKIVQTIALIQVVLGNIGKPGTGFIYSQSDFLKPMMNSVINYITNPKANSKFNEINLIELGNYLNSGDFKILFIYNFNPVSSLPNQNNLRKVLTNEKLFTVVLDMFLNETTKYADIVIPAKFDLETSDLIVPYYIPSLSINLGGPCPYSECMSNYEFFRRLIAKLDTGDSLVFNETEEQIFNRCLGLLPAKVYEDLKSNGYYLLHSHTEIPFQNLKFPTPNNKIQAGVVNFEFGKKEYERKFNRKRNEFILITPSHGHFLHSQLGQLNNQYLKDFDRVYLNSNDIAILDFEVSEKVLISNEYGSAHYLVGELSALKSGVALIYSGASFSNESNVNVNIFTPDIPEKLGNSGSYNSAIIRIQKIDNNMEL
ncbi:MAG: molybdopterin-dependent oxidoreductase, partial [Promethearchaeota archaeon]